MYVLKMCVLLRYLIVTGLIAIGSSRPDIKNSDITFVKIKPVASAAPMAVQNRHSRQDSNSTGEDFTSIAFIKPQGTSAAPALDTDLVLGNSSATGILDDSVKIESTTTTPMMNSVKSTTLDIQTPTASVADGGILNSARDQSRAAAPLPIPRQDQNVNYRESSIITVKPIVSIPKSKKRLADLRPSKRYINLDGTSRNSNPNNLHHVAVDAKKGYKSKCRCSRIWNCPKLQISVPRCLPDYYMCCF